jgi:hypothetical protein
MRLPLPLLLAACAACTGSPDAVTVSGGHGVGSYDSAAGPRSYNSSSNEVGLELTWFLPSTRTMRQDADAAEMMRLFRSMEQRQREEAERREPAPAPATNVTVEAPTVELPPGFGGVPEKKADDDAEINLTIKRVTTLVVAGLGAVVLGIVTKRRKKKPAPK